MTRFKIIIFIFFFPSTILYGQETDQKLRGNVFNTNKEPIPFANVVLFLNQDTSEILKGTVTDFNGAYVFKNLPRDKYWLNISHVGYKDTTVKVNYVGNDTLIKPVSLKKSVENLSKVVKRGNKLQTYSDKTVYHISKKDAKNNSNALRIMDNIPTLVKMGNNNLSTVDGGNVKILINGINSDETDLLALKPKNVERVEFFETPPARYYTSEVSSVVNVITKDNIRGGRGVINGLNSMSSFFGNNLISFKYNKDNSQLGVKYYSEYRSYDKRVVNDKIEYLDSGDFISKTKSGLNSPYTYNEHQINLDYINRKTDDYTFSADLETKLFFSKWKAKQSVDYNSKEEEYKGINTDKNDYYKPVLDLYYNKKLKNEQELTGNLVTTVYHTSYMNKYLESRNTDTTFFSKTDVTGNKYSMIAEGVYSFPLQSLKINTGIRQHNSLFNKNLNRLNEQSNLKTSATYMFIEGKGDIQKLDYTIGMGFSYNNFVSSVGSESESYQYYNFTPIINAKYAISKKSSIRLKYAKKDNNPQLSSLSNSRIFIDPLIAIGGNPNLNPYTSHEANVGYTLNLKDFFARIKLKYNYAKNPIFPYFTEKDSYILQSFANHKSHKRYSTESLLSYTPFSEKNFELRFFLFHKLFKTYNKSSNYGFSHFGNRYIVSCDLRVNNLKFDLFYQSEKPYLDGQYIRYHPSASWVEVKWKKQSYSLGLGWRYPLQQSWNAGYETHESSVMNREYTEHIYNNGNMIYVTFNYNFSFGREYEEQKKKLNNKDQEQGILQVN